MRRSRRRLGLGVAVCGNGAGENTGAPSSQGGGSALKSRWIAEADRMCFIGVQVSGDRRQKTITPTSPQGQSARQACVSPTAAWEFPY